MGLGYQQFSLKRHLINSSQLQCEKSLKFCDPVIWNSIIVQSDCSPRELSAKSIGIAFPKKVPERARSNFITKEHSKVITFIITSMAKIITLLITSAITFSNYLNPGNWKTDNISPLKHSMDAQGRQSPWVWQCTSFQSPSCQKFRWSVVCLCFQLVQPSLVFLQPTSCFMFLSALTTIQNHRCLFTLNWTVDSYMWKVALSKWSIRQQ